ncbi:MAG: ABC transporter substrate-binding protein [Mycobacteriales bacterium]
MAGGRRARAAAVLVGLAAGCAPGGSAPVRGGTASFALPPGARPNYIFPLMGVGHYSPTNTAAFQYLFYRPLYFFGVGERPVINTSLSLARPPVYGDGDRMVTVTLKHYRWSDGRPVSARDVAFWQQLVTANKDHWAGYQPGLYPDNILATQVLGRRTVRFYLRAAVDPTWFTYNELSQITPLPRQVMDTERSGEPVGDYAATVAGAKAVYTYLAGLAEQPSSYPGGSHPARVWSVTDGPWRLVHFGATGAIVFAPNLAYSGPVRARLDRFEELAFASAGQELAALASGHGPSYGYLPESALGRGQALARGKALAAHYRMVGWVSFSIGFFLANMNNPRVGPLLRQAYLRRVLEELVDQRRILSSAYAGYGAPTCGPVPIAPPNAFADAYERSCPYRYDPARAVASLRAHGWRVVPGGASSCLTPSKCGAGVRAGQELSFSYLYATGSASLAREVAIMAADARAAGVVYHLVGASLANVVSSAVACVPSAPSCSWQLANYGGSWLYAPDYYPSGEQLFSSGAGSNAVGYASATDDRNITLTRTAADAGKSLAAYQDYLTRQVPLLWQPEPDYALSMINVRLAGASPQNAYLNLLPENWYWTR